MRTMKTLVYLGCNVGNGAERLLRRYSFDSVLLVEADPVACQVLEQRFKGCGDVSVVNRCLVPIQGIEFVDFYRTNNSVSSSILPLPDGDAAGHYGGLAEKVSLPAAFLPDVLRAHKIEDICFYVSDLQGADFKILASVGGLLGDGKIEELFLETHKRRGDSLYKGADNCFDSFFNLLDKNYKLDYLSHDGRLLGTPALLVDFFYGDKFLEVDSHWSLRTASQIHYPWL